jgi:hypothetical protein
MPKPNQRSNLVMQASTERKYRPRSTKHKNPNKRADQLHTRLQNILFEINDATEDVKAVLSQMLYVTATDDMRYERWNQINLDAITFIKAPKEDAYDGRVS